MVQVWAGENRITTVEGIYFQITAGRQRPVRGGRKRVPERDMRPISELLGQYIFDDKEN